MTTINIKRKETKVIGECVHVVQGWPFNGSVTFLADLPKNALVTGVVVKGKHLEDMLLDPNCGDTLRVTYPKDTMFDNHRVAAVYDDPNCVSDLYNELFAGVIDSFVVEYIETAVSEV